MAVTQHAEGFRADALRGGTSRGTRAWIALQVASMVVLAVAGVLLATWLAERPGLRWRVDLTQGGENTLAPPSIEVLEQLPGEVTIDVFLRAAEFPYQELGPEVHERTRRLLIAAQDSAPGKVVVQSYDLNERAGTASRAENRMRELDLRGIEPFGVLVVSLGPRHTVVHVRGDIADLDPGNPLGREGPFIPARLVSYRGEEALISALLKVSQGDAPKIVFSTGHGELDLNDADERGLDRLKRELERDGFHVAEWEGERSGALPEDASVLCILGPQEPFTEREFAEMELYLESGGRLVAAPGFVDLAGDTSLVKLLDPYGIRLEMSGIIARPLSTASGQDLLGVPQCAEVIVWSDGMPAATNPVTQSLRRADRRVHLPLTRSIDRLRAGATPPGVQLLEILVSSDSAWRDLPDAQGQLDWTPGANEPRGPFVLAMEALVPPRREVPEGRRPAEGVRPEGRILCVGSSDAFANALFDQNRDFLLNAFNWASTREFRVNVARKTRAERRIDVTTGDALARVNLVVVGIVPGLCFALGLWTAWRRRR